MEPSLSPEVQVNTESVSTPITPTPPVESPEIDELRGTVTPDFTVDISGDGFVVPTPENPGRLTVTRFPENIGTQTPGVATASYATSGTGHYMMIFANAQRRTQFDAAADPTSNPSSIDSINNAAGRTDANLDIGRIISGVNNTFRTSEAFVLQIPDTVAYSNQQNYDEFAIGGTWGAAALTGLQSFQDLMRARKSRTDALAGAARNLAPAALAILSKKLPGVNSSGQAIFQNLTGLAINPMMEVIYSKPTFRHFRFDFLLYPRSKSEAEALQNMIKRLRFHHAPEIYRESKGFFLVPPSTFDIKFYYNGVENPNLDPIKTCVLETIDVDYAPQGWAAYEELNKPIPTLGGTGMPVGLRLSLQFKETEFLTKDSYSTSSSGTGGSRGTNSAFGEGDVPPEAGGPTDPEGPIR